MMRLRPWVYALVGTFFAVMTLQDAWTGSWWSFVVDGVIMTWIAWQFDSVRNAVKGPFRRY